MLLKKSPFVALFLCFFLVSPLRASVSDSLLLALHTAGEAEKASIYLCLLNQTHADSLQLLVEYGNQSAHYAQKTMSDSLFRDFLTKIGVSYYRKSHYSFAEKFFRRALHLELEAGSPVNAAKMYSNLAVLNELRGKYDKAVADHFRALEIFEKENYDKGKAFVYNNLGVLYQEIERKDESLKFYQKALRLKKELSDSAGVASTLNNLGVVYEELEQNPDSALQYYERAGALYKALGDALNFAVALENKGSIFQQKKQYQKALSAYREAAEIFTEKSNKQGQAWCYRSIGHIFLETKDFGKAQQALLHGKHLAEQTSEKKTLQEITGLLASLFYAQGDFKRSADFQKQYTALNDSLLNSENQRQINELNKRFETSLLEYKNELLSKENEIQKVHLQRTRFLIFAILLFASLLGAILFLIYKQNKLRSRQKNIELEQKLLRAQINPHFISNALSAIQGFILDNKPLEAADYLSDFSRLMRQTIKNSRQNYILLNEEIESLRDYLKIQQLRFENLFEYEILVAESIDISTIKIPPMLVQPFAENAIKHGFRRKHKHGKIQVRFEKSRDWLQIEVRDNGCGLKKKNDKGKQHVSYSLNITKERLANLEKTTKKQAGISLENLSGEAQTGTKVELKIPLLEA